MIPIGRHATSNSICSGSQQYAFLKLTLGLGHLQYSFLAIFHISFLIL